MNDTNIRIASVIAQSFVLFLAISIWFGRYYHRAKLQILGIPNADMDLDVVEYAITSPEVAAIGVTLAIFPLLYFVVMSNFPASNTLNKRVICIGLLIIAATVVSYFFLFPVALRSSSILWNLLMAFSTILIPMGGAILLWGIPRSRYVNTEVETSSPVSFHSRRLYTLFILIGAMVYAFSIAFGFTVKFAGKDAIDTIRDTPFATIELVAPNQEELQHIFGCGHATGSCYFKVLHISDEFIYAWPVGTVESLSLDTLYAVPKEDISLIKYIKAVNDEQPES